MDVNLLIQKGFFQISNNQEYNGYMNLLNSYNKI